MLASRSISDWTSDNSYANPGPASLEAGFQARYPIYVIVHLVGIRKKFFLVSLLKRYFQEWRARIDEFFKPNAADKQRRADKCDVTECDVGNSPGNDGQKYVIPRISSQEGVSANAKPNSDAHDLRKQNEKEAVESIVNEGQVNTFGARFGASPPYQAQFWMIFEAILIPRIYARLQEIASNFSKFYGGGP